MANASTILAERPLTVTTHDRAADPLPVVYIRPLGRDGAQLWPTRNSTRGGPLMIVSRPVEPGEVIQVAGVPHRCEAIVPDEIAVSPIYTLMQEMKDAATRLYSDACLREQARGRRGYGPRFTAEEKLAGAIWSDFDPQAWAERAAASWAAQERAV